MGRTVERMFFVYFTTFLALFEHDLFRIKINMVPSELIALRISPKRDPNRVVAHVNLHATRIYLVDFCTVRFERHQFRLNQLQGRRLINEKRHFRRYIVDEDNAPIVFLVRENPIRYGPTILFGFVLLYPNDFRHLSHERLIARLEIFESL